MRQLSIDQIKISRIKALQNANDLMRDAEILFKGESWPRVFFLCQISGEKIGKYILLSSLLVQLISGRNIDWKRVYKRLTSHTEKYELVTSFPRFIFENVPILKIIQKKDVEKW